MMESFTFGRIENQRRLERRDETSLKAKLQEWSLSSLFFNENEYKSSKNNKDDIIKPK